MTNDLIESRAIAKLKDVLTKVKNIYPDIHEGEREVTWDGDIKVYKKGLHSSSNLDGVIPVQVKGHEVESFSRKQIITKNDLSNFAIKDNVIFFSVQFTDDDMVCIYWLPMHLFDINSRLENMGNQESKKFNFDVMPTNANELETFFTDFVEETRKHLVLPNITNVGDFIKLKGNVPLQFTFKAPKNAPLTEVLKIIKKEKPYIRYKDSDLGMEYVIGRIGGGDIKIGYTQKYEVGTEEKIYFKEVFAEVDENRQIFKCSSNLKFEISSNNFTFNYRLIGTYQERKTIVNFFYDLMQGKKLVINGKAINSKLPNCSNYQTVEKLKHFFDKLDKLLAFCKIEKIPDFTNKTNEDYKTIEVLYKTLIENQPEPLLMVFNQFYNVEVFGIKILIYINKEDDGSLRIYNWSESPYQLHMVDKASQKQFPVNIFYILSTYEKFNPILYLDNINYEKIINELYDKEYEDWEHGNLNALVLNLIDAFDQTNQQNYLLHAYDICKVFVLYCKFLYAKFNYMQIKYRLGKFGPEDRAELEKILEEDENLNDEQLFGIYTLLENKKEASVHFDKIADPNQKEFIKKLPLYKLFERL